jgi:folylpolyglutamate synthase
VPIVFDSYSKRAPRVLIFNCTSGRAGPSFLNTMLTKAGQKYKDLGRNEDPRALFDHVIFCTNVTYSDGGFKGGMFYYIAAIVARSTTDLNDKT